MKKTDGKFITFIKRNAVYIVLAFCLLAVGLSATLVVVNKKPDVTINQEKPIEKPDDGGDKVETPDQTEKPDTGVVEKPDPTPVVPVVKEVKFIMPVNTNNVSEYSETMVWSGTLNRFSAHKAMDFFAEEGTPVYAVYDGTIESIDTTLLTGVTVIIDHGNGLKSVYNSITEDEFLAVGQKVKQGDIIGEVSVTNRQEYKDGAHLHFEVKEGGVTIDPIKYLTVNEK